MSDYLRRLVDRTAPGPPLEPRASAEMNPSLPASQSAGASPNPLELPGETIAEEPGDLSSSLQDGSHPARPSQDNDLSQVEARVDTQSFSPRIADSSAHSQAEPDMTRGLESAANEHRGVESLEIGRSERASPVPELTASGSKAPPGGAEFTGPDLETPEAAHPDLPDLPDWTAFDSSVASHTSGQTGEPHTLPRVGLVGEATSFPLTESTPRGSSPPEAPLLVPPQQRLPVVESLQPETPRLVIGRLTVEVLAESSQSAPAQPVVQVTRLVQRPGGRRGRSSKLRFGLGQL